MPSFEFNLLRIPFVIVISTVVYLLTDSYWLTLAGAFVAYSLWVAARMIIEHSRAGPFLNFVRENSEPQEIDLDKASVKDHIWYGELRYFAVVSYHTEGVHLFASSKLHGLVLWETFHKADHVFVKNRSRLILHPKNGTTALSLPWTEEYSEYLPLEFRGEH